MRRAALALALIAATLLGGRTRFLPDSDILVLNRVQATGGEICNSVATFDLYRFTVPAGTMGPTSQLRLRVHGDFLQNEAAASAPTFLVVFGATTLWSRATLALAQDVDRGAMSWEITIQNMGSLSSQIMTGFGVLGRRSTAAGIGEVLGTGSWTDVAGAFGGTSAQDTATALDIALQVDMSVAGLTSCVRRQYATLEVIP